MGREEVAELIAQMAPEGLHKPFLTALSRQLEAYVKPHMKKEKPRVLHVGGGFSFVNEVMILATEYTHANIEFADPEVEDIKASVALMDELLAIPVEHATVDIAKATKGRRVEDVQGKFDLLMWRNPPMHYLSERTIHHMLSLGANNAIEYFTSSEPQNYRRLLYAARSYSEPGVTIKILHPTSEEFMDNPLPQSPREMQTRDLGMFPDTYILALQVIRSSRRLNASS